MVPGVVSLRCPACARPFLSLPQREEATVKCPHCQHAGAADEFAAAGSSPGGALIQSLRQRTQQSLTPQTPGNGAASSARTQWPEAPPLFAGPEPAAQPPRPASEPQWPFIETPRTVEESPFAQAAEARTPEIQRWGWADEESSEEPEHAERNVYLGLLLLLAVCFGVWVLWLNLQPPLSAEIPAVMPPGETSAEVRDAVGAGTAESKTPAQVFSHR